MSCLCAVTLLSAVAAVAGSSIVRASEERAQVLADATAHAAEAAILTAPDDLSVDLQADPGLCVYQDPPDPRTPAPAPDGRCLTAFGAAQSVLAGDGDAHLSLLVLSPDPRFMRSDVGAGPIDTQSVVMVRRHLPGCAGSSPPAEVRPTACWAAAASAAEVTA